MSNEMTVACFVLVTDIVMKILVYLKAFWLIHLYDHSVVKFRVMWSKMFD